MNDFGILDFALPFAVVVLVLCWMGIKRLNNRKAQGREASSPIRGRGGEADGAG